MKSATLRTRTLLGWNMSLVMVQLLFLFGSAEWVSRLDAFQAPLTPPKMGSRHYQLGHKLMLLEAEVKRNGPIDCIMIGSSMVDVGFDPDVFQAAYQQATGRRIRCFNFGIDAASAASTFAVMRILMEDFHPRFMIIGTDPRDYVIPSTDKDPAVVLNTPWVQYRQGEFSWEGLLLDNSYLYRYRQHVSRLVHFQFEDTLWSNTKVNFPIRPNGFSPITKVKENVNEPPDPNDTSFEATYYSRIYSSYTMLDENLAALEKMMRYSGSETQVIVVEMPVTDGLYYFFGNGEADYAQYISGVGNLAAQHQIPFWQTEPLDSIPDHAWSDYSHLNVTGAEIISAWLGTQVANVDLP